MTKWDKILSTPESVTETVLFATGNTTSSEFEGLFRGNGSNPVRQLVRKGKTRARSLARKALKRRKILTMYNLPRV